jgi:hypothetical protein
MAVYKIIRIYVVPADSKIQATERMMKAITLGVEKDYHVTDYIKSPEDPSGKGREVSLVPPKGWMAALVEQLLGR